MFLPLLGDSTWLWGASDEHPTSIGKGPWRGIPVLTPDPYRHFWRGSWPPGSFFSKKGATPSNGHCISMLVKCSSNAHPMLIQWSLNALRVMLTCYLETFWMFFEYISRDFWNIFNIHSMLIQCSFNVHPMLIQWAFNALLMNSFQWTLDAQLLLFNTRLKLIKCSFNAHQILFRLFCF